MEALFGQAWTEDVTRYSDGRLSWRNVERAAGTRRRMAQWLAPGRRLAARGACRSRLAAGAGARGTTAGMEPRARTQLRNEAWVRSLRSGTRVRSLKTAAINRHACRCPAPRTPLARPPRRPRQGRRGRYQRSCWRCCPADFLAKTKLGLVPRVRRDLGPCLLWTGSTTFAGCCCASDRTTWSSSRDQRTRADATRRPAEPRPFYPCGCSTASSSAARITAAPNRRSTAAAFGIASI
jgi:hypothetical protein